MSDPVVLLSTGDVVGPAGGVTDNSMVLFSGTSGKLIKGNNAVVTPAGLALLDDVNAGAQLTTLGLTTTHPQFDNSTKQATTEFVQRALGSTSGDVVIVGSSLSLTEATAGRLHILSGNTWDVSLPPVSSVANGTSFGFLSTGIEWRIKGAGSEVIQGATALNAQPINIGETIWVTKRSNGSWYTSYAGVGSDAFKSSSALTNNGYQKLPSGMIIQWGVISQANLDVGLTGQAFTFPIAFPNNVFSIAASPSTSSVKAYTSVGYTALNYVNINMINADTGPLSIGAFIIAIGR